MRELSVSECNSVAGGYEEVWCYGTYTGGGMTDPYEISWYLDMCYGQSYTSYSFADVYYQAGSGGGTVVNVIDSLSEFSDALKATTVSISWAQTVYTIGDLSAQGAELTIQWGLNDINTWRLNGGYAHVTNPQGSALPWQTMEVNWDQFGAQDPNLTNEQVFENFLEFALQ